MSVELSLFILFCGFEVDSAVDIGLNEHALKGLNNFNDFFIGLPLFLSYHFFTDVSVLHIRMPNHGLKLDHRKLKRKLFWEIEINN